MANHVHILLLPKISPSRLLQSMKGFTAGQANLILNRAEEPFWQAESYDYWVRNEPEYFRIAAYIESNPVKAGLVERAVRMPTNGVDSKSASTRVSRRQTGVSAPRSPKLLRLTLVGWTHCGPQRVPLDPLSLQRISLRPSHEGPRTRGSALLRSRIRL
jgi:hypothetical protein